jgi:hypothetical protein
MRSIKKSTKVISALTVAAAAAVSARMAHAVTLTMYYGEESNYANSNNGIFVGSGYDPTGSNANATGGSQFLTGVVSAITPNVGGPTTINVFPGSYLSISIDAVLTGNTNSAAGAKQGGDAFTQPSFLGLSELGVSVSSTDLVGTLLTPYSTDTQVDTTIGGLPSYVSTANINGAQGTNNGGGYNAIPAWLAISSPGDVQPNLPGYDTAPNSSGGVGLGAHNSPNGGAFPAAGNTSANGRTSAAISSSTAASIMEAFAAQSNTASYANATDFLDSLTFKMLNAGSITLTPAVIASAAEYWRYNGNITVAGKTTSSYTAVPFGPGDTIVPLPTLVINAFAEHFRVADYSGGPDSLFGPTVGTLTVSGGNGAYSVAQITGLNGGLGDTDGTVEAKTFNPSTDKQIFAYDILVNGTQANASQIATLVTEINTWEGGSPGVTATALAPSPDPFPSNYNVFLDASGRSDAFMGLDVTGFNDPNLVGYSFSAVAVVPEPMTLGLLTIGGIGLLARRHRLKP